MIDDESHSSNLIRISFQLSRMSHPLENRSPHLYNISNSNTGFVSTVCRFTRHLHTMYHHALKHRIQIHPTETKRIAAALSPIDSLVSI